VAGVLPYEVEPGTGETDMVKLRIGGRARSPVEISAEILKALRARAEAALEKSLQTHFNRPIKLQIKLQAPEQETPALQIQREKDERLQAAVEEIEQDEGVLALQATFDARIVPGSIKPL
jgi:hypothetical protein